MKTNPIRKASLREQAHAALLRLLFQNRWEPGERWNDSALAAELGVSRTPVREALIQMEAEGLVACDPNRGFYLPALVSTEAQQVYPILWSLEQLAVFLSPPIGPETRKQLEQAAGKSSRSTSAAEMAVGIKQDRAWHLALVEASANPRLIALYGQLEAITRRYAAQLAPDPEFAERCAREHAQILEALASDQPARAHALLKIHWRSEMEAVQRALASGPAVPARAKGAAAGRR